MKLPFLAPGAAPRATVPIRLVAPGERRREHLGLAKLGRAWLDAAGFKAESGRHALAPDGSGGLGAVLFCVAPEDEPWAWSALAEALPPGAYRLDAELAPPRAEQAALAWALAAYAFTRYGKQAKDAPTLALPEGVDRKRLEALVGATFLVRDLVNTPAEDMGPSELAAAAQALARRYRARATVIKGKQLLAAGYPAVHAVGRAADDPPRVIDLRWGVAGRPLVALVGKGVCFDSGGLDLKAAANMKLMKKDMGGAAHALALAQLVMALDLPVRLRVLIPAVENAVAGNAYRPLDVVRTRKGLTVEIGNTDAEGRVVLADCLAEASRERPALLLDFATLTGAARVALGTGLPALFANDDALADALLGHGRAESDPLWRLPLHAPYRAMLDSKVADLNNVSDSPYAGAIVAALFLERFVAPGVPWAHLDLFAWNERTRPGRPEGGEAMGLRAAYALLAARFGRVPRRRPALKGRRRRA